MPISIYFLHSLFFCFVRSLIHLCINERNSHACDFHHKMTSLHSVISYESDQQEHGNHHDLAEDSFTEDSFHSFNSSLPSIYGVTSVSDEGCAADTLIVALIKGSVMSYSFKKSGPSYVNAECCELIFKSMPSDSSFTAIDCMRYKGKGLAVAVTFCKVSFILSITDVTYGNFSNNLIEISFVDNVKK